MGITWVGAVGAVYATLCMYLLCILSLSCSTSVLGELSSTNNVIIKITVEITCKCRLCFFMIVSVR